MKTVGRALPFLPLLLLTGCFEMTQEIWINPDGSGRLRVEIGVSEALMSMGGEGDDGPLAEVRTKAAETQANLKKDPNVTSVSFSERKESGTQFFTHDIQVKDVSKLSSAMQTLGAEDDAPAPKTDEFRIDKLPTGNFVFRLKMATPPGMGDDSGDEGDAAGRAMAAQMLGDKALTVKLHGPKIVSSNGTVDAAKSTSTWTIRLVDLATGKVKLSEMTAEVALAGGGGSFFSSLTPLQIGIGAGVLVVVIGLIVLATRRR